MTQHAHFTSSALRRLPEPGSDADAGGLVALARGVNDAAKDKVEVDEAGECMFAERNGERGSQRWEHRGRAL